jgi:hypothetical protein
MLGPGEFEADCRKFGKAIFSLGDPESQQVSNFWGPFDTRIGQLGKLLCFVVDISVSGDSGWHVGEVQRSKLPR